MNIKILNRRSTYLTRTIVYEVDGEIKEISAPSGIYSFEELEGQIQPLEEVRNKDIFKSATEPASSEETGATTEEPKKSSKKSKKTTQKETEL